MKEIVTCSQMKALDNHTIKEMGIPSCVLMEAVRRGRPGLRIEP